MTTVLLVEDDIASQRLYQRCLAGAGYSCLVAGDGATAQELLKKYPAVLVLDLNLPDMPGLDILKSTNVPTVVITSHGSIKTSVDAMRAGAFDFLIKPFAPDSLLSAVSAALKTKLKTERSLTPPETKPAATSYHCQSPAMQEVYTTIASAATSRATIFITGESGTGKEVCAEDIHQASPRANQPFVPLNCAAIPENLLESEIFGHVKGAFTGATHTRQGAASLADGGTLFLDELCEMNLGLQAKLLRFIQTGQYTPVGSSKTRQVDVRFLCATNRDPWAEVQAGRFREDLFYRLYVIPLELPPLRQRGADILGLASYFLNRYAIQEGKQLQTFSPEVAGLLQAYAWPGNIRQLQNLIQQVVVLHDGDCVTAEMLPPLLSQNNTQDAAPPLTSTPHIKPHIKPLWQAEKDHIEYVLAYHGGNISQAARALEVDPSTIHRKKRGWGKNTYSAFKN